MSSGGMPVRSLALRGGGGEPDAWPAMISERMLGRGGQISNPALSRKTPRTRLPAHERVPDVSDLVSIGRVASDCRYAAARRRVSVRRSRDGRPRALTCKERVDLLRRQSDCYCSHLGSVKRGKSGESEPEGSRGGEDCGHSSGSVRLGSWALGEGWSSLRALCRLMSCL